METVVRENAIDLTGSKDAKVEGLGIGPVLGVGLKTGNGKN